MEAHGDSGALCFEVKVLYPNLSLHRKVAQLPFFSSSLRGGSGIVRLPQVKASYRMISNFGYGEGK
jgi:hypothetical protein